ncbi:FG-GAP-like repeat-containing protein [Stieleria marina]
MQLFQLPRPTSAIVVLTIAIMLVGCNKTSTTRTTPQRPVRQMNNAIAMGDWAKAMTFVDAAVADQPDSALVLTNAAQVVHQNKQPQRAAELLSKACRVQNFSDPARVHQAVIAMIEVGEFYESISFLEEVVQAQPDQYQSRRLLYDFHAGTDNRLAALRHGKRLIRQRRFDVDLLSSISNTQQRTMDTDPLNEMTSRNPDDKRPLLGSARRDFDEDKYDAAIDTLQEIAKAHPNFLPAQALLARSLAVSDQFDKLQQWAKSQPEAIQDYPDYWLAIGDWARFKKQKRSMARAYWEATRIDPDLTESWQKLGTALRDISNVGASENTIAAIDQRVKLLSRFNQQKKRFERSGSISRQVANEIAKTLDELGRRWEAEAWASVALTLPEDDSVDVEATRKSIVAKLRSDTPWQSTQQAPEFALDLTALSVPAFDNDSPGANILSDSAASDAIAAMPRDGTEDTDLDQFEFQDEAKQRGIAFHGRTSDDLDKPGIMLYQTLGCGGATVDFDRDGWDDLYLVAAGGKPKGMNSDANALMRNLLGQFTDVGELSQADDRGFGQGAAVGDINADGFPDLLVLNYGLNSLFINNGDGTFSRAPNSPTEDKTAWTTSAAIADIDGDAIADCVVTQYCAGLDPITKTCGDEFIRSCSPMAFPALADVFWQGNVDGGLTDRTEQWNAVPDVLGRGLGVVIGSFDELPGLDVIIANDMTNNHYWNQPNKEKSFELVDSAMIRGLGGDDRGSAQGSMGIATGDFDRDGDVDFYITNFFKEYNIYHEQQGPGSWRDMTGSLQLVDPTVELVGFGSEAADLDNDGDLELVVANGHVDMFSRGDEKSVYEHPMQIFSSDKGKTFRPAKLVGDYLQKPHVGRALWTIDANRDGQTDFAVTHQTEPVALLVNQGEPTNHWIGMSLVGRNCDRDAIGATLEIIAGENSWTQQVTAGSGYMCSNEKTLRVGLETYEGDCAVEVRWPDGTKQRFANLKPDSVWLLIQNDEAAFEMH